MVHDHQTGPVKADVCLRNIGAGEDFEWLGNRVDEDYFCGGVSQ